MVKNKLLLCFILFGCLTIQCAFGITEYDVPNVGNPNFKIFVYDTSDDSSLPFNLDEEQTLGIIDSLNYWSEVLRDTNYSADFSVKTMEDENAAAASLNAITYDKNGNEVLMSMVEADYRGIKWNEYYDEDGIRHSKSNYDDYAGMIEIGTLNFNDYDGTKYPLLQKSGVDFLSVLKHEVFHALGVASYAAYTDTGKGIFNEFNLWESRLRIFNSEEGTEISAQKGMQIWTNLTHNPPASSEPVFNIGKYNPYFVGDKVIKVLGGNDDYDTALNNIKNNEVTIGGNTQYGLVHYQYDNDSSHRSAVWGLPINGAEDEQGDLSHIELRNCLMSHQNYRNWVTFMEAELAVLDDLGYKTNIDKFFGKSYYLNNIEETNHKGFSALNDFGIGLHIYGDNNTITQAANIEGTANATVGARIEGVNNKLIIANDTSINMSGQNNLGIAATYGSGHNIIIENGAKVSANDTTGIGASFDFGKNMLGEDTEHRGSYIFNQGEVDLDVADNTPELNGALVENFDIKGELIGGKASIYISDNAYVKDINIYNGAKISGDIISDWNSQTSGDIGAEVQTNDLLITNLNWGNGGDSDSNLTFSSNIQAQDTLQMNVLNGTLTLQDGENSSPDFISVYNLNIESDAKLVNKSSETEYEIKSIFTNNGTFEIAENTVVAINSDNIEGSGSIKVKDEAILNIDCNETTGINNTVYPFKRCNSCYIK